MAKPTAMSIREELGNYPLPTKYEEEGEGSVFGATPTGHVSGARCLRDQGQLRPPSVSRPPPSAAS